MADKKKNPSQGNPGKAYDKPSVNFDSIASQLKNFEDQQHINQIGPSIAEAYISQAKYVDKNGVVRYKTKFTVDEARSLANTIYDTLIYHSHRRLFNIAEDKFKGLLDIKNPNGKPYADILVSHYFKLDRNSFVNQLAEMADGEAPIDHKVLEDVLKENITHHKRTLHGEIVKELAPEHMDGMKAYVKGLIDKHKLDPKMKKQVDKMHDYETLLPTFINLASQYYQEEPKEEKKKK